VDTGAEHAGPTPGDEILNGRCLRAVSSASRSGNKSLVRTAMVGEGVSVPGWTCLLGEGCSGRSAPEIHDHPQGPAAVVASAFGTYVWRRDASIAGSERVIGNLDRRRPHEAGGLGGTSSPNVPRGDQGDQQWLPRGGGARFRSAILTGATFTTCDLRSAVFDRCDFHRARFSHIVCPRRPAATSASRSVISEPPEVHIPAGRVRMDGGTIFSRYILPRSMAREMPKASIRDCRLA
jgi:hypothetical protein